MPFEFEALVGHLHVVGGRSISAPPPGALVEVAPRRAARGREADTFFALVMPSGDAVAPATFYERMAQTAAERYFSSTGSVTSGLRNVFNTLNHDLFTHNTAGKGTSYEAAIICGVLRGSDLYAGRVGPGVVMLQHQGKVSTFPEDLTNDEALFTTPLGVHPVPNPRMTQYHVDTGARLVFADAGLADLNMEHVGNALLSGDLALLLVGFKELARLQMTVMAVEFVPPEAALPDTIPVAESTTKATASRLKDADKTATGETAAVKEGSDAKPSRRKQRSEGGDTIRRGARLGLGRIAMALAGILGGFNRVLERLFPAAEDNKRRLPGPLEATAILLIPVGVVALVLILWLGGMGETEYELCLEEANSRIEFARGRPTGEPATVISAWEQAMTQIDICLGIRPEEPDLVAAKAEGRDVIDRYNQISRREVYPLTTFLGATLTRVVAQPGQIYALDTTNDQVHRVQLSSDGRQMAGSPQVIPDMRRGATVEGYPIGELIDIAFSSDLNRILALDENGVLISCPPQLFQCEAEQLLGTENFVTPIAMRTWQRNLYILDVGFGDGQIWRYVPSAGSFAIPPEEYFTGEARPVLRSAVDFGIDLDGAVYVLLAEGIVNKYSAGSAQAFDIVGAPAGLAVESATGIFVDRSPIAQNLYIASQRTRTVFEASRSGTWNAAYRSANEEYFAGLASVVVAPSQNMVYAASGNAILAFERLQDDE